MAWTDRYVTDGAAGGGDGSIGTPWTLAEGTLSANLTAQDRVNIQSDSGYSIGAQTIDATLSTSLNNWIWFRGFDAAIDDLAYARLNDGHGRLDTTGWPVITCTGKQTLPTANNYKIFEYLNIVGSLSSALWGSTNGDTVVYRNCSFNNSSLNAACRAVDGDNNIVFINCDIQADGAAGTVLNVDDRATFINCRFHTADTGASTLVNCNGPSRFYYCLFTAAGSAATIGVAFQTTNSSPPPTFVNCTFYNLLSAVTFPNVTQATGSKPLFMNCVVADCTTFVDDKHSTAPWDIDDVNCFLYNVTTIYTNVTEETPVGRRTGSGAAGAIFEDVIDCIVKSSTAEAYGTSWPLHNDIGWARHADPAGGGGLLTHPGMSGGFRG